MYKKNKTTIVLFILIVAIGIATTPVMRANALNKDQVILCVSVLDKERNNDLNCHIYKMKDVDMSDHKFIKNLFSHENIIEPDNQNPKLNYDKVGLLID